MIIILLSGKCEIKKRKNIGRLESSSPYLTRVVFVEASTLVRSKADRNETGSFLRFRNEEFMKKGRKTNENKNQKLKSPKISKFFVSIFKTRNLQM